MDELRKYLEYIPILIRINDKTKDEVYVNFVIEELNKIVIDRWVDEIGYEVTMKDIKSAKNKAIIRKNENENENN